MLSVVTVEEAENILRKNFNPSLKFERVSLIDALGRQLAEDIHSQEPIPGFTRATMDGFAVTSSDTFGASVSQPVYLKLIGNINMGELPDKELEQETAFKVATGGALPDNSDAVVMVEETEWLDDETIAILKPVGPGENIIFKGEDVQAGEVVCTEGTTIRPQDLGILAGIGVTEIPVYERIRIGILSTGNEVVKPEVKHLGPGKIRDINSYALYGLAKQNAADVRMYGIFQDDFIVLKKAIEKALEENHIVVLSGGSSVGTKDLTAKVFDELPEFRLLFHGISVRPGKPTLAASDGKKIIIGLPGHPVSAMVVFDIVVTPLINSYSKRLRKQAVISMNIASSPGRQDYVRVRLVKEDNILKAVPVLGKSGLISTMVESDGFVVIPLNKEGLAAGELIEVELYESRC